MRPALRRWRDEIGDAYVLGAVRVALGVLLFANAPRARRASSEVRVLRRRLPLAPAPRGVGALHRRLQVDHRRAGAPRRARRRRLPGPLRSARERAHERLRPRLRPAAVPPQPVGAHLPLAPPLARAVRPILLRHARPGSPARRAAVGRAPRAAAAHHHLPRVGRLEAPRRRLAQRTGHPRAHAALQPRRRRQRRSAVGGRRLRPARRGERAREGRDRDRALSGIRPMGTYARLRALGGESGST